MTRIEKSIVINKPVDEVFLYVSDWEKQSDWFEGVSDFRPTAKERKETGHAKLIRQKYWGSV